MSFSGYFDDEDEEIELKFSAQLFGKESIPTACLVKMSDGSQFITDSIWGQHNPIFKKQMKIMPTLTKNQTLNIALLELTKEIQPIENYKHIGEAKITVGKILMHGSNGITVTLSGAAAEVKIEVIQKGRERGVLSMIVAFFNMPKNHWLKKNYPQLYVCRHDADLDTWTPVFKSEVMKNQDAGQWDPISIPYRAIYQNGKSKVIRLYVYNNQCDMRENSHQANKNFYKIGYAEVNADKIKDYKSKILTLTPCNPKVARAGNLIIRSADRFERLTFYGQIREGLRFNFSCAISFSSSNRPPRDSKSLHYTPFQQMNEYQTTMEAIGGAVEPYSDGRPFHAWGFAAKYFRTLSQAFPLTINRNKELNGLRDLHSAYYSIFENIVFDKPVQFVPSTQEALALVAGSRNPSDYLVHLIMTNEAPEDLDQFIDLLFENQSEPISVIIVGIGDGDFKELEKKFNPGLLENSKREVFDRAMINFLKFESFGANAIEQFTTSALVSVSEQAVNWIETNVNS